MKKDMTIQEVIKTIEEVIIHKVFPVIREGYKILLLPLILTGLLIGSICGAFYLSIKIGFNNPSGE